MNQKYVNLKPLLLCVFFLTACNEKPLDQQVSQAVQHIQNGNPKVAMLELERILKKHPDEEIVLVPINKIYAKNREFEKIERLLAKPIAEGLNNRELLYSYTEALINHGKFEQALLLINQHQTLFESAQGLALTGHSYSGLNQAEEAKAFFLHALNLDDHSISARLGLAQEAIIDSEGNAVQQVFPRDLIAQEDTEKNDATTHSTLSIKDAKKHLHKVLELEADNIVANYLFASIYYLEDKMIDAQRHVNAVLKIDPDHKESLFLIGRFHLEMGHLEKSEEILRRYLSLQPNDLKARMFLASIMLRKQAPGQALKLLEDYTEDGQQDVEYLLITGNAYLALAKHDQAIGYFKQAQAILPDAVLVKMYSAMAYLARDEQQDRLESIKLLEQILQIEPENSQAGISLATSYLQIGQYQKAEGVAANLIKYHPELPVPWYLSGLAWQGMGNSTHAIMAYEKTLHYNRRFIPATIRIAKIYQQLGDDEKALQHYKATLKNKPYDAEVMTEMAIFEQNRGNIKQALQLLETSIEKNPQSLSSRLLLGSYYLQRGQVNPALDLADEMYKIAPQRIDVNLFLGQVKLASGHSAEAVAIFGELIKFQKNSAEIYTQYGRALRANGDIIQAREALDSAVTISAGRQPDALIELARLELSQGNYEQVASIARDLQAQYPDLVSGIVIQADLALRQGQFDQAIDTYKQALQLSDSTDLILKLYKAYEISQRLEQAAALISTKANEKPDDLRLGMTLATIQQNSGDTTSAIETYNRLLSVFPDNALIFNNLAWLYDETDRSKALTYAEKAYNETPDIPHIIDSYGWFCLLDGKVIQGLDLLEIAVRKSPMEPEFHYHLAEAQIRIGEDSSARESLQKALSSEREFTSRSEAEKLMLKLKSKP